MKLRGLPCESESPAPSARAARRLTATRTLRRNLLMGVAVGLGLVSLWRANFPATPSPDRPPSSFAEPTRRTALTSAPPNLIDPTEAEIATLMLVLQQAMELGETRHREALLTFKDDEALRRFLPRAQAAGLSVVAQINSLHAVRVRYTAFEALRDELTRHLTDYTGTTPNPLVSLPAPPAKQKRAAVDQVPFGNDTLAFIGATGDRSTWGRGTTIAILDTGVAPDATFGYGRIRTLDIGLGSAPGDGNNDGHGTAVAALAAGAASDAPGVAPAAVILSIRVTDTTGTSDLFTLAQAIIAAADHGAKIINISLGGATGGAILDAAITYATNLGTLIVAAAGNDQAAQLAWPAADPRVISVGAIDRLEQSVLFSNSSPQLQLTAPGYGVQTAWLNGQRVTVDGTSASAPLVAGAVAALLSADPRLSPRQAADLLGRTANDTGSPGADAIFGHGILNVSTAMHHADFSYVDTAVSSHFYDAPNQQMEFVVQNRSGRAISGLTLTLTTGATPTQFNVPNLTAGEIFVARVPVDKPTLATAGQMTFTTILTNPPGLIDQLPHNNTRSTLLKAPAPP